MNMCKEHWDKLRESIDTRGLGKFVANNGQELTEHTVRELKGEKHGYGP